MMLKERPHTCIPCAFASCCSAGVVFVVRVHPCLCMFLLTIQLPTAMHDTYLLSGTDRVSKRSLSIFSFNNTFFGSVVRLLLGGLSISITTAKTLLYDVPENGKKIIPLLVESAHLFMCFWVVLRLRKQSPAVARNMPWGCVSQAVPALNF